MHVDAPARRGHRQRLCTTGVAVLLPDCEERPSDLATAVAPPPLGLARVRSSPWPRSPGRDRRGGDAESTHRRRRPARPRRAGSSGGLVFGGAVGDGLGRHRLRRLLLSSSSSATSTGEVTAEVPLGGVGRAGSEPAAARTGAADRQGGRGLERRQAGFVSHRAGDDRRRAAAPAAATLAGGWRRSRRPVPGAGVGDTTGVSGSTEFARHRATGAPHAARPARSPAADAEPAGADRDAVVPGVEGAEQAGFRVGWIGFSFGPSSTARASGEAVFGWTKSPMFGPRGAERVFGGDPMRAQAAHAVRGNRDVEHRFVLVQDLLERPPARGRRARPSNSATWLRRSSVPLGFERRVRRRSGSAGLPPAQRSGRCAHDVSTWTSRKPLAPRKSWFRVCTEE